MAVVVSDYCLLILPLDLGVLREVDVHRLLHCSERVYPCDGVRLALDHLVGEGRWFGPVLLGARQVGPVELRGESRAIVLGVEPEQQPAAVVDVHIAVADFEAERVVVLHALKQWKKIPRREERPRTHLRSHVWAFCRASLPPVSGQWSAVYAGRVTGKLAGYRLRRRQSSRP